MNHSLKDCLNHRMFEVGRNLGRLSHANPLDLRGRVTYSRLPRTMSRWLFSISMSENSPVPLGKSVPVLGHPHNKEGLMFSQNLLFHNLCPLFWWGRGEEQGLLAWYIRYLFRAYFFAWMLKLASLMFQKNDATTSGYRFFWS